MNSAFCTNHKFTYLHTGEGRLRRAGESVRFDYTLKYHLGNTRTMFTITDNHDIESLQCNHYYPFGMRFNQSAAYTADTENRYLYNGKELQQDLGLDWYDYGARFYDAAIGRWSAVDPLAEMYTTMTPYNYTMNNPMRFIDPNGMYVAESMWDEVYDWGKLSYYKNMLERDANPDEFKIDNENGHIDKVSSQRYYISEGKCIPLGEGESTEGKVMVDVLTNSKGQSVGIAEGNIKESRNDKSNLSIFANIAEGKKFYMFAAKSSQVEWGAGQINNTNGSSALVVGIHPTKPVFDCVAVTRTFAGKSTHDTRKIFITGNV